MILVWGFFCTSKSTRGRKTADSAKKLFSVSDSLQELSVWEEGCVLSVVPFRPRCHAFSWTPLMSFLHLFLDESTSIVHSGPRCAEPQACVSTPDELCEQGMRKKQERFFFLSQMEVFVSAVSCPTAAGLTGAGLMPFVKEMSQQAHVLISPCPGLASLAAGHT